LWLVPLPVILIYVFWATHAWPTYDYLATDEGRLPVVPYIGNTGRQLVGYFLVAWVGDVLARITELVLRRIRTRQSSRPATTAPLT
jgi:hypothetical protein